MPGTKSQPEMRLAEKFWQEGGNSQKKAEKWFFWISVWSWTESQRDLGEMGSQLYCSK